MKYYISIEGGEIVIYWIFFEYSKKTEEDKLPMMYETVNGSPFPRQGAYIWLFTWKNSHLIFERYVPTG